MKNKSKIFFVKVSSLVYAVLKCASGVSISFFLYWHERGSRLLNIISDIYLDGFNAMLMLGVETDGRPSVPV